MADTRTPGRRAWDFLIGRTGAYRRLFNTENQDARTVMLDLARFCRAHASTAHPNSHMAARLDGRREAWLRIQQHLELDNETLWQLYDGRKLTKGE